MIDILAQATEIPTGIIAGTTSAGVVMLMIKHISNSARHLNGKKYVSKDECDGRKLLGDERQHEIKADLAEIKADIKKLLGGD